MILGAIVLVAAFIAYLMCHSQVCKARELLDDANSIKNSCTEILEYCTESGLAAPLYFYVFDDSVIDKVHVCACYNNVSKSGHVMKVIKSFDYGDDAEYARLEARELLEHLKELSA